MAVMMKLLAKRGAVETLKRARKLLENETPLKTNCGKICGGACCEDDETGENGMLLFPFEEEFYKDEIEGFPFHLVDDDTLYKGGKRLVCEGSCQREHRPLACRIFPLRMKIVTDEQSPEGRCEPEIDPRAWCVCPLLERGGMKGMSRSFVEAVRLAGEELMTNTYMLEALYNEQKLLDETRVL